MKKFVFFMDTEGGMDFTDNIRAPKDLGFIPGWMDEESTKDWDERMAEWMLVAMVGDMFEHRMGYLVRVRV